MLLHGKVHFLLILTPLGMHTNESWKGSKGSEGSFQKTNVIYIS
jgi:hypothetical protein